MMVAIELALSCGAQSLSKMELVSLASFWSRSLVSENSNWIWVPPSALSRWKDHSYSRLAAAALNGRTASYVRQGPCIVNIFDMHHSNAQNLLVCWSDEVCLLVLVPMVLPG